LAGDEEAAIFLSGMLTQEKTVSLSELKAIISKRSIFPKGLSFQKIYLSKRPIFPKGLSWPVEMLQVSGVIFQNQSF